MSQSLTQPSALHFYNVQNANTPGVEDGGVNMGSEPPADILPSGQTNKPTFRQKFGLDPPSVGTSYDTPTDTPSSGQENNHTVSFNRRESERTSLSKTLSLTSSIVPFLSNSGRRPCFRNRSIRSIGDFWTPLCKLHVSRCGTRIYQISPLVFIFVINNGLIDNS